MPDLYNIVLLLIGLMVCVTVHEAAHAWVAYKLGDPTPKVAGRVSLNPGRHLDPIGTLMIFLIHFGWGKPVIFNYHNLKHPRRDSALIALAGPLTNFLTALVVAIILKYLTLPAFLDPVFKVIYQLSLILFLFNLLPIAPLDGSKFIGFFVPASKEMWYQRFLAQGPLYLIILIIGDYLVEMASGFSILQTYLEYGLFVLTTFINLIT